MTQPVRTHVFVDKKTHKVVEYEKHPNDLIGHKRVHLACGLTVDTHDHDLEADPMSRWRSLEGKAADCAVCAAHEYGEPLAVQPPAFNPPVNQLKRKPG